MTQQPNYRKWEYSAMPGIQKLDEHRANANTELQ